MNQAMQFGEQIRDWRTRRRMSQLALASDARISTRHLSFIETGRSRPSRGMVLHLADLLEVPLRERNGLLLAAGFSPAFPAHPIDAPELHAAMSAVELVLNAHGAYPAVAVDRHWNLLRANAAAKRLMHTVAPELMLPQPNVLRITLHPRGLAPSIANFTQLRGHLLHRLQRQARTTGDARLQALYDELSALPHDAVADSEILPTPDADVVIAMRLRTPYGVLSMFSTITVFGTPIDVTLSELAVEAFFPCDASSRALLENLHAQSGE